MFTLKLLSFFLIGINYSNCDTCVFHNIDFKEVTKGIREPLHFDEITADVPGGSYKLLNATLSGIKTCDVKNVQCNNDDKNKLTFKYDIECPRLTARNNFTAKGKLGELPIDGNGYQINNIVNYDIMLEGIYKIKVGKDKIHRPVIESYTMTTNAKEPIEFIVKYTDNGKEELERTLNKALNENWRQTEKLLKTPSMDTFIDAFVESLNKFSKSQ